MAYIFVVSLLIKDFSAPHDFEKFGANCLKAGVSIGALRGSGSLTSVGSSGVAVHQPP